jgi:hypothetical protein
MLPSPQPYSSAANDLLGLGDDLQEQLRVQDEERKKKLQAQKQLDTFGAASMALLGPTGTGGV